MSTRSKRPDLRSTLGIPHIIADSFREGRKYYPEFARFQGDPEAVIGSRSEAVSLLKRRGWSCNGTVNVESEVAPPPDRYEVADNVVQHEIDQINLKEHEGHMSPKVKEDLFHTLKKKRSGSQDSGGELEI
jgi:hypothetical protein